MVTRSHGNVQDAGSNPAGARNQTQTLGTPLQKVAQWSEQDLNGRLAMLIRTRPVETEQKNNKKKNPYPSVQLNTQRELVHSFLFMSVVLIKGVTSVPKYKQVDYLVTGDHSPDR